MMDKYNFNTGRAGILSLISQREQGYLSNSQYKTNATSIKVDQLPKLSDCTTIFSDFDDGYYWHFLRSSLRGDIVGVCWNCSGTIRRHNSVCVCQFTYSLRDEEDASVNARPFIREITKTYQIFQNMLISDTADLSFRHQKPLLIVGHVKRKGSVAIMSSYHCDYVHKEYEWIVSGPIYCCASEINSANFALGCVNGFYICKNLRLSKKYNLQEHVVAADFNNDGNLLFISCSQSGIQLCDMRENFERRSRRNSLPYIKESALSDSSLIANRMKLLSDQVTLIVSDEKGFINKVDLRMKKSVFQYPEHQNFHFSRPLNFDEDLDLLCAVGSDNCCRIWSLSSGKLNWANKIAPANYEGQPLAAHACIISSERRWFVAVVQNDTVIPIVPGEAQMVTCEPDTMITVVPREL